MYFKNHVKDLLKILVELQLVVEDYFVPLVGFSFELCGNAKQNTSRRTIIDVHASTNGQYMISTEDN